MAVMEQEWEGYYSCIMLDRTCGKASLPGMIACANHAHLLDSDWTIDAPELLICDAWLKEESLWGSIILEDIRSEQVHEAHRTLKRQAQLDAKYKEEKRRGVQLFGTYGVRPNVRVKRAFWEAEDFGYRILQPPHLLDLDAVYYEEDKEDPRIGNRAVRIVYEYAPDQSSIALPGSIDALMDIPWAYAWVWVNIRMTDGARMHSVELVGPQVELKEPRWELTFRETAWWPESYKKLLAA